MNLQPEDVPAYIESYEAAMMGKVIEIRSQLIAALQALNSVELAVMHSKQQHIQSSRSTISPKSKE